MLQLKVSGMTCGHCVSAVTFVTAYPVNRWLIRTGLKEKM
jgi:hypothetical protein